MRFKKLKISIAFDFALLLAIAMLLLNLVFMSLWQKNVTKLAIQQARSSLEGLAELVGDCESFHEKIRDYNKAILGSGSTLYLYDGTNIVPDASKRGELSESLLASGVSGEVNVRASEKKWSLLGIRLNKIVATRPLGACQGAAALGLVVNLKKTHEGIFSQQSWVLVYILVNVIVMTTIGFFRMRKNVVGPLEKLVTLADASKVNEENPLTMTSRKGEFGHVAAALQSMIAKIEHDKEKLRHTVQSLKEANEQILKDQKSLVEAEKFAAVGRLSAGLAHEIGNPLGIIQGYVELLGQEQIDHEQRSQFSQRAGKELQRVSHLVCQLLDMARKKVEGEGECSPVQVLRELVLFVGQQKKAANVIFEEDFEIFPEKVQCGEADLHQILLNCLLNSIDAIEEKGNKVGRIRLGCRQELHKEEKLVCIEVEDNGCGIDETIISSIYDPFFTTKEVGYGTGLGLSVCRSLVENHCGSILIQSKKQKGTIVTIRVPLAHTRDEEDSWQTIIL